jgi:hypothetical protein
MSTTPANWGEFANVTAVAAPALDGKRVWNESGCSTAYLTAFSFSTILKELPWGRTGFDLKVTPEAACRGWYVGLVKNRTKK